jgi:hypothetical protein
LRWRDAALAPRSGERWRWLVQVSAAAETRNFAGIDAARALFRDRVHLVGRVIPAALTARRSLAETSVDTWRARIATRIAIQEMVDFLAANKKMDKHQAYQLTSLQGDVAITQLVDGTMGVHVKMPKSIFK